MRRYRWFWSGLALFLMLVPAVPGLSAGPGVGLPGQEFEMAPRITLVADPAYHPFRIMPPRRLPGLQAQGTSFTVDYLENESNVYGDYCTAWSPAARAAFQYAVDLWAAEVQSPIPIEVEACWSNLGSGILGSAGPTGLYRDVGGGALPGTWYPVALANVLAGRDLNGTEAEISVTLNSFFSAWYLGTDGDVPGGSYDMSSVVLHEVCHGLGLIGSMTVSSGLGGWGLGSSYPLILDRYLENGSEQALLNTGLFLNPSAALGDQLRGQGGGVYLDAAHARAANGGGRVPLYAPSTWEPGSSIYHVSETYNSTLNALMTKSIASGEVTHDPGPVVRGILEDLGWAVTGALPDLSVTGYVFSPAVPRPGEPITIKILIANQGQATATGVTVTNLVPPEVLSPSCSSMNLPTGLSLLPGTTFVWELPSLPAGTSGTITIDGILDPDLEAEFAIWNMASVAAVESDSNPANNQSQVLIGGARIFLPLTCRDVP